MLQEKEGDYMNKRKISILGDSISTYSGYTPKEGVFYDSHVQRETGVATVDDTWWMQVIRALGGELLVNNSLAGSMVSGNLSTSAMSDGRIRALGDGENPDMILVCSGSNDWGFCVLPEEFAYSYGQMLHKLKRAYPHAQIWCSTLPEGKEPSSSKQSFFNVDGTISKRVYSRLIREEAEKAEVHLADLEQMGIAYETVDGIHPNKKGMIQIARMWIDSLKK